MTKKILITIAFQICFLVFGFAQSENKEVLYQKTLEIKSLAQEGYDAHNAELLMKAAKVLIETPQIQPIENSKFPSSKRSKYFNLEALLLAAYQYTPKNKQRKLKRIKKMQAQISTHKKMALADGTLWVQEIETLDGGQSLRYPLRFAAEQNVEFRLDNFGELSLSVHYAKTQPSLKKAAFDSPILFDYTTDKAAEYDIEIKNMAASIATDSVLMIMY